MNYLDTSRWRRDQVSVLGEYVIDTDGLTAEELSTEFLAVIRQK